MAERFAVPVLEDIYAEACKRAKLRRALSRVRSALRVVLKTRAVPEDLGRLTQEVQTELKR